MKYVLLWLSLLSGAVNAADMTPWEPKTKPPSEDYVLVDQVVQPLNNNAPRCGRGMQRICDVWERTDARGTEKIVICYCVPY